MTNISLAEQFFKNFVWDQIVKFAIKKLIEQVPFFGWGPMSFILNWIIVKFANILYSNLKDYINLQAIAFVNEEHQRAFDRESIALKIIAEQKGIDSDEFKIARERAKTSLSKFVRFNPDNRL